jgi:hypothetical protein
VRLAGERETPGHTATIEYQGNIDSKPLAKEDNAAKALDLKLQETDIKVITADQLFE